MSDSIKLEVVTAKFDEMLAELAAIDPRVEFRTVIVAVGVRVIQGAANRTRAAQAGAIRSDFNEREYTTLDGKRYKLTNHYPNAIWGAIQAKRKDSLAVKLASRGLAKKSWLFLARLLGHEISVPDYVTGANYRGRTYPGDTQTQEEGTAASFALTIVNSSPIVQAAGGYNALVSAMAGEVGYFHQNMKHQFYLTAARRVAKYPGIFIAET